MTMYVLVVCYLDNVSQSDNSATFIQESSTRYLALRHRQGNLRWPEYHAPCFGTRSCERAPCVVSRLYSLELHTHLDKHIALFAPLEFHGAYNRPSYHLPMSTLYAMETPIRR